jgi:peroxiredoxin
MKSNLIGPGAPAPDFELPDLQGTSIRLSNYRGRKVVVLAFLRGFL